MYVIGIRNQKIRQALLKEQDPDIETTEKIIQLAERLENDVRHFDNTSGRFDDLPVAKLQHHNIQKQKHRSFGSSYKNENNACESCGSNRHLRVNCKYRQFVCNHCKRTGHLERVCRQKQDFKCSTKHIDVIYKLNAPNLSNQRFEYSSTVSVHINNYKFIFELDTGTFHTIVNVNDWHKFGAPSLRVSTLKLRCYGGMDLNIKGECNVTVQYKNQYVNLPLVVISGTNSPLLGLQWIHKLRLDLNEIIHTGKFDNSYAHKIDNPLVLQTLLNKYQHVLNNELGHCTKLKAHIYLKSDAIPKFFKPRLIPFAYIDGVKDEIQRNVTAGILERIDTSDWAAPIVPVIKPNGKIRICGDFKVTINPQMLVDQHPIPSIDALLARLRNGKKFSKLDLSDAYLQIELDDENKNLTVINTPLGLFRYNRLPFGISNAPAIFQRVIDQAIAGIPNCIAYLDDILLTGATEAEHLQTLQLILSKLDEFGFRCNPEKCKFFQDEISYLGFIIDQNGKRPDPKRIEAIIHMPHPKNIKELEAFIGKINYYRSFILNFSDKCKLLNQLRKKNTPWVWNQQCQHSFNNLLKEIAHATTLVHFDSQLPIILATDASAYGIGAVLMHRYSDHSERPIAHASKTLTSAEQNYSQIEKEALSIVYGIKKFHQYLAGRSFELYTDHRPLVTIFNPTKGIPNTAANRLQRWALFLMGYDYTIRFKNTQNHANADALSRLPIDDDCSFVDNDSIQINYVHSKLIEQWPIKPNDIARATSQDNLLNQVKQFILTSWPSAFSKLKHSQFTPFFNNRHSLSVLNGCILKDSQVVIPEQLQHRLLHLLHRGHLGIIKMKQLARSHCWWPTINRDLLNVIRSCQSCAKVHPMPKQQFQSWEEPKQVWSRLHMDFAGPIWGSKWLILVDSKSKFPIVADMNNNTTATHLIGILELVIDWFGPPEILVSDNGPPFNSYEMKKFYDKYHIHHITTAPYHPASNGLAERFVRSFKESMLKQKQGGQNDKVTAVRNFLRNYRWTPLVSTGISPANMLLRRPIRTELDMIKPIREKDSNRQTKFMIGQPIWTLQYQMNHRPQWTQGIIVKNIGSMLYEIRLCTGQYCKRHQNQLRDRSDSYPQSLTSNSQAASVTDVEQPSTSINKRSSSIRRYPRRERKPPDRYTPHVKK